MSLVMRAVVIVTVFLHCVGQTHILGQDPLCQPQPSCSECIRRPGCAWCTKANFLKPDEANERRCDSPDSLKDRKCNTEHVINPKNIFSLIKDTDLNDDPENVVQLKPQNVKIKLRVGVPHVFPVEFKRAQGHPIDLYYLMDLSYSMKDDLEQIKTLGQEILKMLKDKTETVRIGFGSFVDKEMLPYVSMVKSKRANPCPNRIDNCQKAFSFQNFLPLTSNAKEFEQKVRGQIISGNLDSPEAGLDAIMQAVVCKDQIKWGNVTKILVYTSDDTFHMAGDGRLAGVFQPHNGKCHLNAKGSYDGRSYDYPSVGHLSRVLQDNNIQLIFAVTEDIYPAYKALSSMIPQSVVGVLKNDSSNVVDIISEAYGNLSSTLVLEEEGAPKELSVRYRSNCIGSQEVTEWKERGECQGIKHENVMFQVRLEVSECLKEPKTFRIKLQGISEEVKVTVATDCHCDCGLPETLSEHCNGTGNLTCGLCRCPEGFLGQNCECEQQKNMHSTLSMLASCRPNNSSLICSGHGSCKCGKCVCLSGYNGEFCSCEDRNCELYLDRCNEHRHYIDSEQLEDKGNCKCGVCECKENYTGRSCECSPDQENCKHENGLCNGQGTCVCNGCKCNSGFTGVHCSVFINRCTVMKDCVACHLVGGNTSGCAERCLKAEISHLDGSHELECTYEDTISYEVKLGPGGKIILHYANLPSHIDKTIIIIGSSVTSIIIIGIVIIIIYRVLLELYDIREYRNFVKSQKQTEWKEDMNPLFKGATTTVFNPLHTKDE